MSNGSGPSAGAQGRTLLGFGSPSSPSQFPSRKPRNSRSSSAFTSPPPVVSPPRVVQVAGLADTSAAAGEEEEEAEEEPKPTSPATDLTNWQSQLVAEIEAKQRQADNEASEASENDKMRSGSYSEKRRSTSGSAAAPTLSSPTGHTPGLVDYGSRRRASLTPSNTSAVTADPADSSDDADAEPLIPTTLPLRPVKIGQQNETPTTPSAAPMKRYVSGSATSSSRKTSRRGYTAEEDAGDSRQNAPRDLLAAGVPTYPGFAPAKASPASVTAEEGADEQSSDPSEEATTPARRKRGIFLSSTNSPAASVGRRSRRSGPAGLLSSAGDTSSQYSHDASVTSSLGRASPSLEYAPAGTSTGAPSFVSDHQEITFPSSTSDDGSFVSPDPASFNPSEEGGLAALGVAAGSTFGQRGFRTSDEDEQDEDDFHDGASLADSQDRSVLVDSRFDPTFLSGARAQTPDVVTADEADDTQGDQDFDDNASFASGLSGTESNIKMQSRTSAVSTAAFPPAIPVRRRAGGEPMEASTSGSTIATARESDTAAADAAAAKAAAARRRAASLEREQKQKEREEWERHILSADWEELEVARYLNEFGKHVYQVRSTGPLDPHHQSLTQSLFPSTYEWTEYDSDGEPPKFDRLGYSIAWFTALLTYISPNRMVDLQGGLPVGEEAEANAAATTAQTPEEFRWQALKANGERFYLSALPLYEMLGSRLRKTWRWESKIRSLLSLVAYTFLWWRGLLLASTIFATIMLVLTLKTYPPKPDTLREILARQRRRAEGNRYSKQEARAAAAVVADKAATAGPTSADSEGITADSIAATAVGAADSLAATINPTRSPSRYSLVAEASKRYGLQVSVVAGALADGHERAKNFALWRSPRATWRLLLWLSIAFFLTLGLLTPVIIVRAPGAILGICFFFVAPIAEYRPHWLGVEWSNPFDWIFAGVPNDAQYSLEILRSRAAKGKPLISDQALLLRPEDAAFVVADAEEEEEEATQAEGVGRGAASATAAAKSNKINWSKWSDRVLKGKTMAIRGSEMLAGQRSVPLPRLPVNEVQPSAGFGSFLLTNLSKGVNYGLETLESRSAQSAAAARGIPGGAQGGLQDMADVDGTYWSIYDNCCGHLVITPQTITFRSLFAKRPRGRRGMSTSISTSSSLDTDPSGSISGSSSLEQPILDPLTGELTIPASELEKQPPKVKVLLQVDVAQVRGLKKLDSRYLPYGSKWSATVARGEGLRVMVKMPAGAAGTGVGTADGTKGGLVEVDFWQVVKRNEAFNRLVALVPREWEKVF